MPAIARAPSPLSSGVATGFDNIKMAQPSHHPHHTARFSPMEEDLEPQLLPDRDELALLRFDQHALKCDSCRNPLEAHRQQRRLCQKGHKLAEHVANIIFSKGNGSVIYYTPARQANQLVRVHIPDDCNQVLSLLQAFERSLRHRDQQHPIISYDRIYAVSARPVSHTVTQRRPRAPSPPRGSRSRRLDDPRRSSIVAWAPQEELAEASRFEQRVPRTNYQAPSVEDEDERITPVVTRPSTSATPAAPPSPTTTTPVSSAQPTQNRPRQSRASTTIPPSPTASAAPRRQQAPPANIRPEAPEPPLRTERAEPTQFAYYNTTVRQPPASQPRQSQAPRTPRWGHSRIWRSQ